MKIRVPKDIAQNFHFEGPQVAERALDGDVWTVTFQKELTGNYALSIAAQVPVGKQAGDGKNGAKGYSFAVKVPVISPLDVVRASGLWAVEANTETEIRFDAVGMNELDSLLAPQLADYAPRHRVIGVFGWLGADYALTLNGVRHAPAGMLAAVVDALELNTVISTSGTHRHEAIYRLRASGVEYFDVALPQGAALLSAAIDGTAVKPVTVEDRPGSVRLPLPAKRDANTGVIAALVYETTGGAWKNRGKLALNAPSIATGIPVLKSTWRVWVPEGFSFSDIESNLPVPEAPHEELLVRTIGRVSLGALGELSLGTLKAARESAGQVMWDNEEMPAAQSHRPGITDMNVDADQLDRAKALEKLPGSMRGRFEDGRKAAQEGTKSELAARELDGKLAPKAPAPQTATAQPEPAAPAKPQTKTDDVSNFQTLKSRLPESGARGWYRGGKTAGLLPVTLDLPKTGPALVFDGLYAPERLEMRYDDWWSRARALWIWFVAGGVAFYLVASRRPWWRTLWAVLVLSAVPLCVSVAWMPVCNALLGGWLAGLVLNRVGAWCVFRVKKEVLA